MTENETNHQCTTTDAYPAAGTYTIHMQRGLILHVLHEGLIIEWIFFAHPFSNIRFITFVSAWINPGRSVIN